METKINLKPCPYCGGSAYIEIFSTGTPYISAHHKKNCQLKPDTWLMSSKTLKKQIKAWNMRTENSINKAKN